MLDAVNKHVENVNKTIRGYLAKEDLVGGWARQKLKEYSPYTAADLEAYTTIRTRKPKRIDILPVVFDQAELVKLHTVTAVKMPILEVKVEDTTLFVPMKLERTRTKSFVYKAFTSLASATEAFTKPSKATPADTPSRDDGEADDNSSRGSVTSYHVWLYAVVKSGEFATMKAAIASGKWAKVKANPAELALYDYGTDLYDEYVALKATKKRKL